MNRQIETFWILFLKEVRSYFLSPFGYVIMALVMILNGVSFRFALEGVVGKVSQYSLLYQTFNSFWFWMVFFLLFPLLTMRLIAEERRSGTMETLLTAPVSIWSVVLSKYLASLAFYCVLWIPSMLNFGFFEAMAGQSASASVGAFWSTYLMLFLVGALNLALGLFASSLTSSMVIAGVIGFCLVIGHFLLGFSHQLEAGMPEELVERARYFSTFEHLKSFSQGLFDTRPLVYYLSTASLVLVFTCYHLESRRWR